MNTTAFVSYINKTRKLNIPTNYYDRIQTWREWWEGFHGQFHKYKINAPNGTVIGREMYTMHMAKRVCESWASLLLNEQTLIELDDTGSQEWLCGKDNEDGILADLDFWDGANKLVELAFRSGTGAFVMRMDGLQISGNNIVQSKDARILLEYLPAECILPITVRHGMIQDVAFMSEIMLRGEKCIYLETHTLEADGYRIENEFFKQDGLDKFTPVEGPAGIPQNIHTHSNIPWFGIIRPNLVVNLPAEDILPGMGMAVFANAIDQLKACDMVYNNFVRDFYLGGKKVFYDRSLITYNADGNAIVPDDISQQLFMQLGDGNDLDHSRNPIEEYNPSLRVEENRQGIQAALDYLSFACGLGTRHFRFDSGTGQVTATQYTGDRQDMRQSANKHQITIKAGLVHIIQAILYAGKTFLGASVDPECGIRIMFDDSYINDSASERETDRQDVMDGTMAKWEYRAKWRGESEEEARRMVADIGAPADDDVLGFTGGGDA